MAENRILTGRAALVTGAAGGLGLAMARKLASLGADVLMTGTEPALEVEAARGELANAEKVEAEYRVADLSSLAELEALVRHAQIRFGGVDVLVNNAVVRHFAPIQEFTADQWDKALAVNLSAPFHLTRLLLPGMRQGGYGRIFNLTSVYGSHATVNRVDYVTTKTAIQGLTRATAMENTDGVITCHALCPGSVLTPSLEARVRALGKAQNLDFEQAKAVFLEGKNPSGRFVEAEHVAEVMALLCGPVGIDMNGAILPIEGGWLARA